MVSCLVIHLLIVDITPTAEVMLSLAEDVGTALTGVLLTGSLLLSLLFLTAVLALDLSVDRSDARYLADQGPEGVEDHPQDEEKDYGKW